MARKPTGKSMDDSTKGPLELKLTQEEAASKIQLRIDEGKELIDTQISSDDDYGQLKMSYQKWDEYNVLLLSSLFTISDISDEYARPIAGGYSMSSEWRERYRRFLQTIASKITRLESIVNRLELIPIASTSILQQTAVHTSIPQQTAVPTIPKPKSIFIGHGRSKLWARVKTFLHDDHNIDSFSFESETHVGQSIVPVLQSFLDKATFAILILTAEDGTEDGKFRARQNVIHEAGLFQGKLGFNKVVLLNQNGLENFSNVDGLQYIGFKDDNIEQAFYEISRVLKREGII